MEVQLKPWGNSQGIRLPKAVLNEAGFQPDDTLHKTLEERAAAYDGKMNLDGGMDWRGEPVGNEVL